MLTENCMVYRKIEIQTVNLKKNVSMLMGKMEHVKNGTVVNLKKNVSMLMI